MAAQLFRRLGSVRPGALRYIHARSKSSLFSQGSNSYNALLMGGGAVTIGVVIVVSYTINIYL